MRAAQRRRPRREPVDEADLPLAALFAGWALADEVQRRTAAGRRHRAAVERELAEQLGAERVEAARQTLVDALEALGGSAAVRGRRVRPPI